MAAVFILLINSLFKNKSLSLTYMLLKSSYNARDGVQISFSLPFVINLLSWIVHSKFNKHLVKLQDQNLIFVLIEKLWLLVPEIKTLKSIQGYFSIH